MSKCVNKAILMGNVGSDPEIRTTSSGTRVARVSMATNHTWTDKAGNQQERTEWHRLTFWGRLVDIVEQWVRKGDRIYIEGEIRYSQSEYEGTTRYWTDIHVRELVMLGGSEGGDGRQPEPQPQGAAIPPVRGGEPDDDLPF